MSGMRIAMRSSRKYLPGKLMEKALGVVFALVGALELALEFWK